MNLQKISCQFASFAFNLNGFALCRRMGDPQEKRSDDDEADRDEGQARSVAGRWTHTQGYRAENIYLRQRRHPHHQLSSD